MMQRRAGEQPIPPTTEDGGVAWQWPAASAPNLGLASDNTISWPLGLGAAEDGAQHGAVGGNGAPRRMVGRCGVEWDMRCEAEREGADHHMCGVFF